ncbi:hypothetical protein EMIHUDRAFT_309085 [Emiliania huxleyi CCMP1516]|uniref:Uncharacterized protein n=2 Tax=Emiliania huxleyi TaxID=2903 RepID=A0A0D3L061_EMIH1|nr:hypothetical protein EMIHUDRAFT_309085 [Emiliania huxleyi CCMP1516]EOD41396.1 hypothetical protein EMIHUDRAFT_309085 [Emiliania huxleyi CCMP1516]|eukprot:XP_005793825.1 hypothetical protein EMIHUDRAFT_309085 [Emiliania huxleyi CCMP1516]
MWASGPAAAARPFEAGLGPARDGWPPTSALALLVKMAAVSTAATVVQSLSAFPSVVCRLSSVLLARTAADSATAAAAAEHSRKLVPDMLPPCGCCRRAWRTIGSFGHQSEITREQLSLPLASPPSPSGIRGILWVSRSLDDTMKYSDRQLAGLSARPPDRVELNGAGSLGYGTGPSFG